MYASCQDAEEVIAKQNEWLELARSDPSALGEDQLQKYYRQSGDDGEKSLPNREHGLPGELPPSDDGDYYDGYNVEEQEELKVDKFGNFIIEDEEELQPSDDENYYEGYDAEEQEELKVDKFGNFMTDEEEDK